MVATVVKPVFRVAPAYPLSSFLDDAFPGLPGSCLCSAQPGFELAEGQFDGVEIRRVRRQIQQAGTAGFDHLGQPDHFVGRQVVEHDHVAGYERGTEHLLQVGGKDVAVDGPTHGHGRLQDARGQGGHQRHVRPAVQRRGQVGPPPAFGPGVAAAIGQVGAGFVHELETGKIFGLHGFQKRGSQRPHAGGVALGSMNALFFRCKSSACTARQSVVWLTTGPPMAANHVHNSARVASGS